MKTKAKQALFLVIMVVFIMAVVGHNFYRYFIIKNYIVHAFIECDPVKDSCFQADPDIADPAFQTKPYAKVEMLSTNAPSCLEEHTCIEFFCSTNDTMCTITYCSEDSKNDGESCTKLTQ